MCNLTSGVFENREITYPMEVDQSIAYMQRILRGAALKKYKAVLMECKESAKDPIGEKYTLGDLKVLSTEEFWTWDRSDEISYSRDA